MKELEQENARLRKAFGKHAVSAAGVYWVRLSAGALPVARPLAKTCSRHSMSYCVALRPRIDGGIVDL
jgi:hypothetical protein